MLEDDKKTCEILNEVNSWGDTLLYFRGVVIPIFEDYILYETLNKIIAKISGYIIYQTEKGIGIIPLDNFSAEPILDDVVFIPQEKVKEVIIRTGIFSSNKKIIITTSKRQAISFKVDNSVILNETYEKNINLFIAKYKK